MIRKATKNDVPEIVGLHIYLVKHLARNKPERYKLSKREKEVFSKKLLKLLRDKDAQVLVFEDEKKGLILGYGIGRVKEHPPLVRFKRYGELDEIVVSPKSQKKGIGSKLVKELIKLFKARKIKVAELLVDSKNKAGIRAWSKLGFADELVTMSKHI